MVFMLDLRSAQLRYPREFATASLHFNPGFGYSGEEIVVSSLFVFSSERMPLSLSTLS